MSSKIEATAVTSGSTYTWPADGNGSDISIYRDHTIQVTSAGSGVGTITADLGNGVYVAVAALSAPDYDTYLLPNCTGIKVAASVADIVLSIKSFSSTEK
jgi:hypothetical protein